MNQTEEISFELDKSFERIENAKKSIDFNLREKSKGKTGSWAGAPEVY